MIRNIIFDVGQVLVDFRWQGYMRDLGFSEETIRILGEKIVMAPIWGELDLGLRPEEEIVADMIRLLPEYEAEIRAFLDDPADVVRPFPKTRQWLSGLKKRGYKIYLLSNYPRRLFSLHERASFNFMDLIDGKVVSAFENLVKPQREIYELLLNRYELQAGACVFLDDRPVNLEAAEGLGIKTIHVTDQERAIECLEELLQNEKCK